MSDPNGKESREENPYQAQSPPKSSRSCCLWGCLGMFLLMVLLVVGGGFGTYWWLQAQLNRYTADAPADLPIVELPEGELTEIQARIDTFKETIEAGETPEDLVLTAEELNALITQDDEMRGRVYVTIEDGEITGDVSIPVDFIPGGKGRFFNASATFDVSLENGVLIVTIEDAEVKGEKLPQQFIDGMSKENLAKEAYKDPEVAATLGRIESITIEQDKIILKPRIMPTEPAADEAGADETPPSDEDPPHADAPQQPDETTEPASPAASPPSETDAPRGPE